MRTVRFKPGIRLEANVDANGKIAVELQGVSPQNRRAVEECMRAMVQQIHNPQRAYCNMTPLVVTKVDYEARSITLRAVDED